MEAERVLSGQGESAGLECHGELRLGEITKDFLAWLTRLGPFGIGNVEPMFFSRGLRLLGDVKVVKERHLRLTLEDDGARMSGMAWSRRTNWALLADAWGLRSGSAVDVAYHLRENRHPDFGGWEMEIVALRPAS